MKGRGTEAGTGILNETSYPKITDTTLVSSTKTHTGTKDRIWESDLIWFT